MNTYTSDLMAELERNRIATIKEDRARRWLAEVNAVPTFDHAGIEQVPAASRMTTGEIECMYCSRIIPARTPQRTCSVCVTKWRTQLGDGWYTQDWHQELVEAHAVFCADRPAERPLPMSFQANQVTERHDTYSDDLLRVSPEYREVYEVVTAMKEEYGFGKRRVLRELKKINRERAELRCTPLPIPAPSTLTLWLNGSVDESRVELIVAELFAAGLGARRIRARLTELKLPAPSLATICRWSRGYRVAAVSSN